MAQPMPASSSDLRVTQRHEEDTQPSPAWPEEISMKGTGRSQERLKNQKLEEQEEKEQEQDEEEEEEEGDEKFHDPIVIDATSDKTRLTRPRPITLYHRSLFRFTLSCRSSPSSSAALEGSAPATSLRQLFKKERSGEGRDFDHQQESADEFWWKKAMRMTILVFRSFSSSVWRCYKNSVDCCAAGLNREGFGNENSVSRKRNYFQRQHHRQEAAEKEKIQGHFAASLDSVRAARPIDCSRDQCGWGQEYSSPGQFSWESTPTHYDYSNRQLIQQHQQQPAHSIISTITTTTEMLYYSSNLMTPYEIHHSLRRTFSVDDSELRSK